MRVSTLILGLLLGAIVVPAAIVNIGNDFDVKRVIPDDYVVGVTFTPNGDLFTYGSGTICRYANAVNLPDGQTLSRNGATCAGGVGFGAIAITSSKNGRIYTTDGYEIDATTLQVVRQAFDGCGALHGIAMDPRDGAMFLSYYGGRKVFRVPDPDANPNRQTAHCNSPYFDTSIAGTGFDGITIGPDGKLYGAGYDSFSLVIVSAYSTSTPTGTLIASKGSFTGAPDGISICVDNGESFALVAMTRGTISRFKLTGPNGAPLYTEDTIADGVGGYLDFSAVDPKGCIWGSATSGAYGFYRVKNRDGSCGCASAQVPTPPPCGGKRCMSLAEIAALPN
jgi:sugar lactone lactonase YvrE